MHRVALPFVLVVLPACVGTHGADSARETSGDSSTGTPPCDLLHPWAMTTAGDVGLAAALGYPDVSVFALLDGNAMTGAETAAHYGDACPTFVESDDGSTITVAGECTTSWGSTYGGTATFGESGTSSWAEYDHFYFADGLNPWGYDVDGSWLDEDFRFSFDVTLTMLGEWSPEVHDVTVTYRTVLTYDETGHMTAEGYADILSQPGSDATGDLCVEADVLPSGACESEDDGEIALWGDSPATLTWNGSTTCDGCADVAIDGLAAGPYCPL